MSPSVISGNKIQIKNFRMFLVIYFELRQYWFNWRKLNRSEVEAASMAHTVWRNLTEKAWTNNLSVVSTAAGSTFRTSFWCSTVFTGTYIFTDTAKISWEKFISTNSEWSHCRLQWICNKSLGDFEQKNSKIQKNSKLVIMIHNILSSKFHFQKWWSGFFFRKTRSVTFPKFQRKKLWPG